MQVSATVTHEEQVERDQAAMEEARAAAEAAGSDSSTSDEEPESDQVPVNEEEGGQFSIGGPGTEPRFSSSAGGRPPSMGEIRLAGGKFEWDRDMKRGDEFVLLVRYKAGDPTIGDTKSWPCGILEHVELRTGMSAYETLRAAHDFESRVQRDRAAIDQAAQVAQQLIDVDGVLTGGEVAERIRELLYARFEIKDDPYEATHGTDDHGTDDHDEESEDGRSIGEIVQDEADSIDAAEAAAAVEASTGGGE